MMSIKKFPQFAADFLKKIKTQPVWLWGFFGFWTIYLSILWSLQYSLVNDTIYAGWVGSWADGAAHLTYSAKFAYGQIFNMEHPILAGAKFTYPFLADAIIGLFVRFSGISLFVGHQIFGFLFSLLLIFSLYSFYQRFYKSKVGAILGVNIFLLSGGLGFYIFLNDVYKNGFLETVSALGEYTQRADYGLEWMNFISAQLIPQRALLLGLPLGLLILSFFWGIIDSNKKNHESKLTFGIIGFLMGLLPFIHSHSFLVMTGYLGWTLLLTLKKINFRWLYFLIPFVATASMWIFYIILPSIDQGSFIKWSPGWMAVNHNKNWLLFWWWNWGLFVPMSLYVFFNSKKELVLKIFPFIGVFILANLWLFQPYDWDNTKFFTWVHLVFSGLIGTFLAKLWNQTKTLKFIPAMIFILLIFSGSLQAIRLLQFNNVKVAMYTVEELNLVEEIKQHTKPDSLFLTSDKHHHPITNLTGRKIMMGYPGWLWTYGFNYWDVERDIRTIYAGGDRSERFIKNYGIDYLVFDPSLPLELSENEIYFAQRYKLRFKTQSYRIYQID